MDKYEELHPLLCASSSGRLLSGESSRKLQEFSAKLITENHKRFVNDLKLNDDRISQRRTEVNSLIVLAILQHNEISQELGKNIHAEDRLQERLKPFINGSLAFDSNGIASLGEDDEG